MKKLDTIQKITPVTVALLTQVRDHGYRALTDSERGYLMWASTWLVRLVRKGLKHKNIFYAGPWLTFDNAKEAAVLAQHAMEHWTVSPLALKVDAAAEDADDVLSWLARNLDQSHPDIRIAIEFFRIIDVQAKAEMERE
jgi:hypothetical protein